MALERTRKNESDNEQDRTINFEYFYLSDYRKRVFNDFVYMFEGYLAH